MYIKWRQECTVYKELKTTISQHSPHSIVHSTVDKSVASTVNLLVNHCHYSIPRAAMAKLAAVILVLVVAVMAVGAVDITGFTSTTACSGAINTAFPAHGDGDCAPFTRPAGSVLFTGLTACKEGIVYDSDCANIVSRKTGPPSSICFIGGGFTSAKWRTVTGCV